MNRERQEATGVWEVEQRVNLLPTAFTNRSVISQMAFVENMLNTETGIYRFVGS